MENPTDIPGYFAPVHRALIDPIPFGRCAAHHRHCQSAPWRPPSGWALRLWLVGLAFWLVGHLLAVWAAKRDAQIAEVVRRHLRYPSWFGV